MSFIHSLQKNHEIPITLSLNFPRYGSSGSLAHGALAMLSIRGGETAAGRTGTHSPDSQSTAHYVISLSPSTSSLRSFLLT